VSISNSFFFIEEDKWLKFAEELAGGIVICKDGVAMFDSLCVKERTNACALSSLTMHMCAMVGAQNVWKDFVREGLKNARETRHTS